MDNDVQVDLASAVRSAIYRSRSRQDYDSKLVIETLTGAAARLAGSQDLRIQVGADDRVWVELGEVWIIWVRRLHKDGEEQESFDFLLALSRFFRNLVAGVAYNQSRAFEGETTYRSLIFFLTSFVQSQNELAKPLICMAVQMLSNIVTGNDQLQSALWGTYMQLPDEENVLIRLLPYPDVSTKFSTMILLLNCVHENFDRGYQLASTPSGIRVCISLLDQISILFDAEEDSPGNQAFDMGYEIFQRLFDLSLADRLWHSLQIIDEIITPHQTTLLKLIDSYVQSDCQPRNPSFIFLAPTLLYLSAYAQASIRRVLPPSDSATAEQDSTEVALSPDLKLPPVLEAMVLVAQCVIALSLEEQDGGESDCVFIPACKTSRSEDDQGLVESIVELLRLLDRFLPRITFGKVQPPPPHHPTSPLPRNPSPNGNPIISPSDASSSTSAIAIDPVQDPAGFSYIKRDLVRVLGILCHGDREVQDRMRACGGIQVIMNSCVIDDRNPYLREHALFALRNLLLNNTENQDVVKEMKPLGEWGEDGVLRDMPGRDRR